MVEGWANNKAKLRERASKEHRSVFRDGPVEGREVKQEKILTLRKESTEGEPTGELQYTKTGLMERKSYFNYKVFFCVIFNINSLI